MATSIFIYISTFQLNWSHTEENPDRPGRSCSDRPYLAYKTMVPESVRNGCRSAKNLAGMPSVSTSRTSQASSAGPQAEAGGMQVVRESFRSKGLSEDAIDIITQSWRSSTTKQYQGYINKWLLFCHERKSDPFRPPVNVALDFLCKLFRVDGLHYSAMNTARSALSTFVIIDGLPLGQHFLVKRFLKGVFNLRPALPRYNVTWDVNIVLDYLKTLSPVRSIGLSQLTQKLVTLFVLLSAQRAQTIHLLDVRNMRLSFSRVQFEIGDVVKQSGPGRHVEQINIVAYAPDRRLCIVTVLKEYLRRTLELRGKETKLFVATTKPHKAVSQSTVSRWIRETLTVAGIDMGMFAPHSTRGASVSCAARAKVPVNTILRTAGWNNAGVFRKYYEKPLSEAGALSKAVLDQNQ